MHGLERKCKNFVPGRLSVFLNVSVNYAWNCKVINTRMQYAMERTCTVIDRW